MGAAARSRPLAEGCSSTSQARPLGCGLILNKIDLVRGRRAAASPQRWPAARVPQVRFKRVLRRLRPEQKHKPTRVQQTHLILNFAVPNRTAAGRSFAPRRPAKARISRPLMQALRKPRPEYFQAKPPRATPSPPKNSPINKEKVPPEKGTFSKIQGKRTGPRNLGAANLPPRPAAICPGRV